MCVPTFGFLPCFLFQFFILYSTTPHYFSPLPHFLVYVPSLTNSFPPSPITTRSLPLISPLHYTHLINPLFSHTTLLIPPPLSYKPSLPLALFSNTQPLHQPFIQSLFPLFSPRSTLFPLLHLLSPPSPPTQTQPPRPALQPAPRQHQPHFFLSPYFEHPDRQPH